MRIKKGDKVQILAGKDKGKSGPVAKVLPSINKVIVEGVNVYTKHQRRRKQGEKGVKVQFAAPIGTSKLMVICPRCGKPTRVGSVPQGEIKMRQCKKCKGTF